MTRQALIRQSLIGLVQLAVAMGLCLFPAAGTLRYWQAWAFLGVFVAATILITWRLLEHDPQLLEHRLKAGPTAEKRRSQQVIQAIAGLYFCATLILPALDHRFGLSHLPVWAPIGGDALVALGFLIIERVFRVNTFTAATVQVESEQRVIATGPYAVVRHPMYSGALLLFVGIPLALGSAWGMALVVPALFLLAWRLTDEERLLVDSLPGYAEYRTKTRFRLIPFLF